MNRAGGTLIGGEDVAHGKFQQGFIREDAVAKIGVIGGGAFGTAMACVMRRSRHEIALWAREPEVAAAINKDSLNPLFLRGIRLAAGIVATNDLGRAKTSFSSIWKRNSSSLVACVSARPTTCAPLAPNSFTRAAMAP